MPQFQRFRPCYTCVSTDVQPCVDIQRKRQEKTPDLVTGNMQTNRLQNLFNVHNEMAECRTKCLHLPTECTKVASAWFTVSSQRKPHQSQWSAFPRYVVEKLLHCKTVLVLMGFGVEKSKVIGWIAKHVSEYWPFLEENGTPTHTQGIVSCVTGNQLFTSRSQILLITSLEFNKKDECASYCINKISARIYHSVAYSQ